MSDGGIVNISGDIVYGTTVSVTSSVDVQMMGNLNVRRSSEKDWYRRFLLGDFCPCPDYVPPDVFFISQEVSFTAVAADTTVVDSAGSTWFGRIYNFDNLPGTGVRQRVFCSAFPQSPAATRVTYKMLDVAQTTVVSSSFVDCVFGLNELSGSVLGKPTGSVVVTAVAAQTVSGKSGSFPDFRLVTELVGVQQVSRIWNLCTRIFEIGFGNGSEAVPTTGGSTLAVFDFSQIPTGATVKIALTAYCRDADATYNIRVSDVSEYETIVGTVVMSGSFAGELGGIGNVHSALGTFINSFSGVKIIKITGVNTGGSGTAAMLTPTFVMYY